VSLLVRSDNTLFSNDFSPAALAKAASRWRQVKNPHATLLPIGFSALLLRIQSLLY